MPKPLTPWSEGWIEAVERERDMLESLPASALITLYGEREAMLVDEVVCDVTFARHVGPWIDDEHETECWEPLLADVATFSLWDLKRRVDRNTRHLIDKWVMDRAEKNVRRNAQDRQEEYADYMAMLAA